MRSSQTMSPSRSQTPFQSGRTDQLGGRGPPGGRLATCAQVGAAASNPRPATRPAATRCSLNRSLINVSNVRSFGWTGRSVWCLSGGDDPAVGQRRLDESTALGAIAQRIDDHRDLVSGLEGLRSPADTQQGIHAGSFYAVFHRIAVLDNSQLQPAVRVGELPLLDGAVELDILRPVEHRE